jgi:hypothetical protein
LLEHMPPACARQATDNPVGPQVDIVERPAGRSGGSRTRRTSRCSERFRFAQDSPLERSGFEPSVPRKTHYGSILLSCPFCHGSRSAKGTHPFRDRDRFRPFTQTGGAP